VSTARPLLRREGVTRSGRSWLIRPTRPDEDAVELLAIRDEVAGEGDLIAAVPGERTVLEESLALATLASSGGLGLTVEVDDCVAGQLMVHRRAGRYEQHRGDLSIALRAGYRGDGLGRAMMEVAVEWARAVGLAKLTLGVFPSNEAALALYREMGFVEEGVLRGHLVLPAGPRDLMLMGMAL
jgi:RimJ/RimL family protein N-acetyltransferase